MKAILKKLYGNNKRSTSVKTELREVKLSKLQDIKEVMDDTLINLDLAIDAFEQGKDQINFAKDTLSNESDYNNAADQVTDILLQINDIGIEVPREIEEIDSIMLDIQDRQRSLISGLQDLGISI